MPTVELHGQSLAYRLPRPRAAVWIATLSETDAVHEVRAHAGMSFLAHCLGADDMEDLAVRVMLGELDMTDTAQLVYTILAEGSARRYWQDSFLCAVATTQWPTVRGMLVSRGTPDPLRQIPTLYGLLDAVEAIYLENADEKARAAWQRHYLPSPSVAAAMLREQRQIRS